MIKHLFRKIKLIWDSVVFHVFIIFYNPFVLYFFYLKKYGKYSDLKLEQFKKTRCILIYSYENIPFYRTWFDKYDLNPYEFNDIKNLEKLPPLTKDVIKKNIDLFEPIKNITGCRVSSTGGSTGTPFKYKMSKKNRQLSFAILLKGWSFAGYKLGDTVVVLAGGSLVSHVETYSSKLKYRLLNIHKFSTYGLDQEGLYRYLQKIIKLNPLFIRGYASAIFLFAEYINNNNLKPDFQLKAIFTTAEMLYPKQRLLIEHVFGCNVYDGYGLNDGAITAFECNQHKGYHIDFERGLLEVVDEQGKFVFNKEGKILATTLEEKCMPLIRYDTGDLGVYSDAFCCCGNEKPILKELKGRITDFIRINGKVISSPVLTVLMGKTDVVNYQINQTKKNTVIIKMVYSDLNCLKADKILISSSLKAKVGEFELKFEIVDRINVEGENKHKFIINSMPLKHQNSL